MANCLKCNTPYDAGAMFCDNCGAQLPQPGAAPQASAPAYAPPQPAPSFPAQAPTMAYYPPPAASPSASPAFSQPAGAALALCPQCSTPITPGAVFCDNCGASLAALSQGGQGQSYPPPGGQGQGYGPQGGQGQGYPPPGGQGQGYPPPGGQGQGYGPQGGQGQGMQPAWGAQPHLVVQATNASLAMPPNKPEYILGREDPVSNIFPDIDLTPHGGDEGGVGRRHARLYQQGGQWFIEDLNSTNFTYVNNAKVQPKSPVPLQNGVELRLGRVKLTFYLQ